VEQETRNQKPETRNKKPLSADAISLAFRLEVSAFFAEMSFDDFRLYRACFSSLAGAVLTFFAYFFASRQKK
jgi:hypothetical protein